MFPTHLWYNCSMSSLPFTSGHNLGIFLGFLYILFFFLLCFFLFLFKGGWGFCSFFFFPMLLHSFSYIIFSIFFSFYPLTFLLSFRSFLLFACFWIVFYVVQDHLMFLSYNIHWMLCNKVALELREDLILVPVMLLGSQWTFVHYIQHICT